MRLVRGSGRPWVLVHLDDRRRSDERGAVVPQVIEVDESAGRLERAAHRTSGSKPLVMLRTGIG